MDNLKKGIREKLNWGYWNVLSWPKYVIKDIVSGGWVNIIVACSNVVAWPLMIRLIKDDRMLLSFVMIYSIFVNLGYDKSQEIPGIFPLNIDATRAFPLLSAMIFIMIGGLPLLARINREPSRYIIGTIYFYPLALLGIIMFIVSERDRLYSFLAVEKSPLPKWAVVGRLDFIVSRCIWNMSIYWCMYEGLIKRHDNASCIGLFFC